MTYMELVAKVRAKAALRAERSCRLMHQRIADIKRKYIEGWDQIIKEADDQAGKFGIAADNDEQRVRVLEMVLAAHGISLDDPAPKANEGTGSTNDGSVAGTATPADSSDPHSGRGSRSGVGESAGSVANGQQADGVGHKAGRKRPRSNA